MFPTQPLNFQTPCFFFSQGFVVPECDCKLEGHRLPPGHHLTDNWTRQQPGGQACSHLGRGRSQRFCLRWPSASLSLPTRFSSPAVLARVLPSGLSLSKEGIGEAENLGSVPCCLKRCLVAACLADVARWHFNIQMSLPPSEGGHGILKAVPTESPDCCSNNFLQQPLKHF